MHYRGTILAKNLMSTLVSLITQQQPLATPVTWWTQVGSLSATGGGNEVFLKSYGSDGVSNLIIYLNTGQTNTYLYNLPGGYSGNTINSGNSSTDNFQYLNTTHMRCGVASGFVSGNPVNKSYLDVFTHSNLNNSNNGTTSTIGNAWTQNNYLVEYDLWVDPDFVIIRAQGVQHPWDTTYQNFTSFVFMGKPSTLNTELPGSVNAIGLSATQWGGTTQGATGPSSQNLSAFSNKLFNGTLGNYSSAVQSINPNSISPTVENKNIWMFPLYILGPGINEGLRYQLPKMYLCYLQSGTVFDGQDIIINGVTYVAVQLTSFNSWYAFNSNWGTYYSQVSYNMFQNSTCTILVQKDW